MVVSWVLRTARARWLTTILILWATYREFVPSARSAPSSTDAGRGAAVRSAVSHAVASRTAPAPFPAAKDLVVVCATPCCRRRLLRPPPRRRRAGTGAVHARRSGGDAGHAHEGWGGVGKRERSLASIFSGGMTRAPAGSLSEATVGLVSRAAVVRRRRRRRDARSRAARATPCENVLFDRAVPGADRLGAETPDRGGVRVQARSVRARARARAAVAPAGPLDVRGRREPGGKRQASARRRARGVRAGPGRLRSDSGANASRIRSRSWGRATRTRRPTRTWPVCSRTAARATRGRSW